MSAIYISGLWKILRKFRHVSALIRYIYYHKMVFKITNTKFDISFCVFKESFIGDQYGIRAFIKEIAPECKLTFIDLGRNHGLVFYYFLYYIEKMGIRISSIDYIGVEPSPLKFVYYHTWSGGPKVKYRLIDKAIIFDNRPTVYLKYGERNFGNFNISGSNYEEKQQDAKANRDFIQIEVDTITLNEIVTLLPSSDAQDICIVKVDCKNRTDVIFVELLRSLQRRRGPFLISCEHDGSAGEGVMSLLTRDNTLIASNVPQTSRD